MLELCLYIFQAMMPLIASPLYGFLYKRTLETFSGAFILLNVFLYLVVMMMASWVYLAMKKQEMMKIMVASLNGFLGLFVRLVQLLSPPVVLSRSG